MVEIEIVSGFLGAGKTTFLNQYLPVLSGRTVIIENECGEVSLDSDLLPKEIPVKEIYGGCICCSLVIDLQTGIKELIERFQPDRIIIEPSGLGRLSDIMRACERLCETDKEEIVIKKKITIVDAQSYDEFVDGFGVFYSDQIQCADILLLGKTEEMDKSEVERIAEDLTQKNPDAVLYCGDLRNMELQNLKKICEMKGKPGRWDVISDEDEFPMSWHGNFLQTITIRQPKQMSEEELVKVLEHLKKETNGRVLRVKGRIESSDHRRLQFDFTMSGFSYKEVREGACGVVVIGLRLNQPDIERMFQKQISAGLAMITKFKREGGRKKCYFTKQI